MPAPSNSVTVSWTDPAVGANQLAIDHLIVTEIDLVASTSINIGTVGPGVQTFITPVLPPGASRAYGVSAVDTAGSVGPRADSDPVTVPATGTLPPGKPSGVTAVLNP